MSAPSSMLPTRVSGTTARLLFRLHAERVNGLWVRIAVLHRRCVHVHSLAAARIDMCTERKANDGARHQPIVEQLPKQPSLAIVTLKRESPQDARARGALHLHGICPSTSTPENKAASADRADDVVAKMGFMHSAGARARDGFIPGNARRSAPREESRSHAARSAATASARLARHDG